MKQLITRTITAIFLLGALVLAEAYASAAPELLFCFAALLWGAAFFEFQILLKRIAGRLAVLAVLVSVASIIGYATEAQRSAVILSIFVSGIGGVLLVAARAVSLERAVTVVLVATIGIAIFGLGGLGLLRVVEDATHNQSMSIWLLSLVIVTDIGGYVFGNIFGGTKLSPIISPGKTVVGALGATGLAVMAGPLVAGLLGVKIVALHSFTAAFCITVAAQSGDLLESLVKRIVGVKDSGALLPGHGGAWDRIDGLLAAAAVFPFILLG